MISSSRFLMLTALCVAINSISPVFRSSSVLADESKGSRKPAAQAEVDSDENEPLLSVVLLQKKLPALSERGLAGSIQKAWNQTVSAGEDGNKEATDFVLKGGPGYMIQCKGTICMMIVANKPYLELETLNDVKELRTRKMLEEHRTWVSVDLMGDIGKKPIAEQQKEMNRVIRLAAELIDKNTVGLLLPSENIVLPMTDEIATVMKGDDALSGLRNASNAAVLGASDDDPEMLAATAEARRTWPDFVKAFNRKPNNSESFAAKFPFDAPDQKEFMWIEVVAINKDSATGRLGNDPVWVKDLKLGDEVTMKISDLSDWMYLQDGEIVGGYTIKVLMKKQQHDK